MVRAEKARTSRISYVVASLVSWDWQGVGTDRSAAILPH